MGWLAITSPVHAQDPSLALDENGLPLRAPFRIGYLRADPEAQSGANVFYALREFLISSSELRRAMEAERIDDVILLASDSHQDLIQRMGQEEFDLVFCPAMDYVLQEGRYEVLYQLRRPEDVLDTASGGVFHQGVIFANNRSPLFEPHLDTESLGHALMSREIAMVGSFSAVGYVYPCLKIAELTSGTLPWRIVFCDSSEEVVKYVINGIAEVGACEAGAIDRVLSANNLHEQRNTLVRELLRTEPVPVSPVVLLSRWAPNQSALGRKLSETLPRFFDVHKAKAPKLEKSSGAHYTSLRNNLEEFRKLRH